MANLTLAIPDNLQKKMRQHPEIRWSEVVRMEIQKKIEDMELMDRLTRRSRLSAKETLKISESVDEEVARKLGLK